MPSLQAALAEHPSPGSRQFPAQRVSVTHGRKSGPGRFFFFFFFTLSPTMLYLLSPAKSLDYDTPLPDGLPHTTPQFVRESTDLIEVLRTHSPQSIASLMALSDKLAALNVARYQAWRPRFTAANSRQAVLAFNGDVYDGLQARSLSAKDFAWAQDHVAILSGLYGVLRPLDRMQPYRLEMGTSLKVGRKKNLYAFWGTKVTEAVNAALAEAKTCTLVNLASQEYFEVLEPEAIDAEIITPVFKEERNGKFSFMSFFGKKARGLMADYIIRERLTSPVGMKQFDREGYRFNEALSSEREWVFTRKS